MLVAGVDGCRAGWIAFKIELPSLATSVEVIDFPSLLTNRPSYLASLGIDIPIGLLDGSRACDKAAGKLLGQPRGTSVFAAPCRAALTAQNHAEASAINRQKTGRGLSQQAFGIGSKIKQVDDAITPEAQQWAFEGHPEVCFWALNQRRPMMQRSSRRCLGQTPHRCSAARSRNMISAPSTEFSFQHLTMKWSFYDTWSSIGNSAFHASASFTCADS
jgi:predicted RNase H-like nuclease